MKTTTSILLGALLLATVACGSDSPSQAATAAKGDAFCTAAKAADVAGKAINYDTATPEELKAQFTASIATGKAAQKVVPKDAVDIVNKMVALQEKFNKVLADNNYDTAAFAASDAGLALINDPSFAQTGKDLDAYLADKCGIAPD